MIVACPNCQSKYNLPEEKIAPTGSKVRCARCKHVFTAMPPGKDFDRELEELSIADAPAPKPAPAPEPEAAPKKMPWEDDEPAGPFGAPAAAAAPAAAPAADAAPKKMPWDDDEPAAGPADDDDFPAAPKHDAFAGEQGSLTGLDEDAVNRPAPAIVRPGQDAESRATEQAQEDDFLNSLGAGGDPHSLDAPPPKANNKKKFLILGVALALVALLGGALFFFKPWTKFNIPFLSGGAKKESAENTDKVKDIALRNVRQYYIPNDKTGNVFVVEGKAVNNFQGPKERIKVEISLFDEKGHVLASKQLLCGNTLSQFQLQVQSEEEINASLSSEVGILTSNTYLKNGMDTPFMAVFFKPPDTVKEFGVKVVDALDPK